MSRDTKHTVNIVERAIRGVDRFQQSRRPLAFAFAVVKKFGDDSGSSLAALIAYYGFLSLFPLLLVLVTILGLTLRPDLQAQVLSSALAQFPIVGDQLTGRHGIQALRSGSVAGLIVGLIGLLWGTLGITQAAQRAMAEVWNIPGVSRPGFVPRLGRGALFLAVLGIDVVLTTVLAAFASFGSHAMVLRILAVVLTVAFDAGLYILAFRVLTPKSIGLRSLIPGAILAGVGWAVLQYVGTLLVGHQLRHTSQIYGYFASVLGLIAFLYLAAEITLYGAEFNVVRTRRLYPRSIVQPPLTQADLRTLTEIAKAGERRPEQRVEVEYPGIEGPGPEEPSSKTS